MDQLRASQIAKVFLAVTAFVTAIMPKQPSSPSLGGRGARGLKLEGLALRTQSAWRFGVPYAGPSVARFLHILFHVFLRNHFRVRSRSHRVRYGSRRIRSRATRV